MAAPKPWKASVAMSRKPSTSARGRSVTPRASRLRVELVAEGRAPWLEQQLVVAQLVQGDLALAGERMIRWDDEQPVLVEERFSRDLAVRDRQVDNGEVEAVGEQLGHERGRGGVDHYDAHLGVALSQLFEHQRHEPAAGRADAAEPDVAGHLVAQGGHVGLDRFDLVGDVPHPAQHRLALLGERPAASIDEGHPQLSLEPGDVGGDVRLDRVQLAGGGRERAGIGDAQPER